MNAALQSTLDAVASEDPQVHHLAMLASLAARIEAPLLRRLRLQLMPSAEPGVEGDLWFSPLIDTFDTEACLLDPWIANCLRLQLKASGRLDDVWRIIQTSHTDAPPSQRIEEQVAYLALRDGDFNEQIVTELRKALKAMVSSPERGLQVARWALHALPRLPQKLAILPEVGSLSRGMAARIQVGSHAARWSDVPLFEHERDAWVLPRTQPGVGVEIGLRREAMSLLVCTSGDVAAEAVLTIPDSRLRRLQIRVTGGASPDRFAILRGRPGESLDFEATPGDIEITTEAGEVFGFEPVAAVQPKPAMRRLKSIEECKYLAYMSYAQADDLSWNNWITYFSRELELTLPTRLRGIRVPKVCLRGDGARIAGNLIEEELSANIADSFAMFVFVHDNYVTSDWCLKELEYFKSLAGEDGFRERLYLIAMSESAIRRLTSSEQWRRLCPFDDQVWNAFYQGDHQDRPIDVYAGRGVLTQAFWHQFVDIRDNLAKKIRESLANALRARLPEAIAPVDIAPQAQDVVRLYIEINLNEPTQWNAIGDHISQRWTRLIDGMHIVPPLVLRVRGFPLDEFKALAPDAHGVVLLWGRKTSESLVAQINKVEHWLTGPDLPPCLVACLIPPQRRRPAPIQVSGWEVLHFNVADEGATEADTEDAAALDEFLRSIIVRGLKRRNSLGPIESATPNNLAFSKQSQ